MPVPSELPGYSGQTACGTGMRTPLRDFLRTETGSAAVLLTAALAALVWANAAPGTYESFWETVLAVRLGDHGISLDLREWVNSGLMTLFFFVIGLEARREFDMGELRERRRIALPLIAGVAGMAVPVAIYLAVNTGAGGEPHGWGAAMSTDTAFALGMLALVGSRLPDALRVFILTVAVVDDFVALGVIAVAYSGHIAVPALLAAVGVLAVVLLARAAGVRRGAVYALLATALWVALLESGVDPVVAGLAMGLLTYAYPAARSDLERASDLFRLFREQPTPELERSVRAGLATAISPNERLQRIYHPWTSYVIVPLFALANAGITLGADRLGEAFRSPVTLGILLGYLLGKPAGILGSALLTTAASRGRLRPPVGWGAVAAGGSIAGIGFTVSLLIATLAFDGPLLDEAKVGILAAVACSSAATWLVTRAIGLLPRRGRMRALLGTAEGIIDLAASVDLDRDHVRGPADALVTVVEYGDFECPYCGQAEPVVRELLAGAGDIRYVWRHLPLNDVHPHAQLAAEAAEAAAEQDCYWAMHDLLLAHQGALTAADLMRYAEQAGLEAERFRRDLRARAGASRVAEDVESADLSGVSGTPTFFVNGRRHHGAYDIAGLKEAVRSARERAALVR
ncbi:Na(+)/H(+) antiporter NhaA 2 [Kitasatospora sp. NE20-6]|uniref:Na+/H+ antiporter NhaA n=1 Tax=Kitasatospora sp. NE20-6 TaxID=2859066 RepID=UPI0034DC338D